MLSLSSIHTYVYIYIYIYIPPDWELNVIQMKLSLSADLKCATYKDLSLRATFSGCLRERSIPLAHRGALCHRETPDGPF